MIFRNHLPSFARLFLPFFVVVTLFAPAREAQAFVFPPGVIPPPAFVSNAAGANPAVAVGIAALAVGAVVGYLLVGAVFGDNTTDAVRIQLNANASAIPKAPAAAASVVSGNYYAAGGGGLFTSYQALTYQQACEGVRFTAAGLRQYSASLGNDIIYTRGVSYWRSDISKCHSEVWAYLYYDPSTEQSYQTTEYLPALVTGACHSGYTLVSGSCSLTLPRLAVSDKKQDVLMTGSGTTRGFSAVADLDTPVNLDGTKIAPVIRGDGTNPKTSYVYGKDSSGRTVVVEVAVSPDGTQTYVRHYTQDDSSGQSQIQKTSVTVDAATGTVTAVQRDIQVGAISSPSSANLAQTSVLAPTVATTPLPTVTTSQVVSGSSQSATPSVVFPSDYARTGEAGTAAATITPKLDTIHTDLTAPGTPNADPVVPAAGEYTGFGNTFGELTAWTVPAHVSTCPTPSFSVPWGPTFTISSHCDLITAHWSVLQTAMMVVWTIAALFIVLGA